MSSGLLLLAQLLETREAIQRVHVCQPPPCKVSSYTINGFGRVKHTTVSVTNGVGVQPRGGATLLLAGEGELAKLLSP